MNINNYGMVDGEIVGFVCQDRCINFRIVGVFDLENDIYLNNSTD